LPILETPLSQINFGVVTINLSKSQSIQIRNAGGGTLTGSAGASGAGFGISSGSNINLGAGQGQSITIQFSPTSEGQFSGTVTISTNGGSGSFAVSGTGEKGPSVVVSPSGISFPDTPVGQNATNTFTIRNDGGGTLTGNVTAPAPFGIVSGGSFSLGAGQSHTVTVRFSPTSADFFSDFATVNTNAGSAQVTLSGEGISP
jgi:hypothetical protein